MTKTTIQQALSTYESHAQTLRSSVASAEVELEAWTAIANDLAGQHATAKDIATTIMLYPDENTPLQPAGIEDIIQRLTAPGFVITCT